MGKFDDYINVTAPIHSATVKGKLGNANEIFLEGDTQNIENEIKEINSRHEELNTKHESLSRTVQGIATTGGASTANNVTYNNDSSKLNAENAQDAIDELQGSKIDKTSILQESGDAEDKVMSQKVISAELSNVHGAIDEVSNAIEQAKGEYICLFNENGYYYPFEQKVNKAGYIVAYIDGEFEDTEKVNIEVYDSTNTNLNISLTLNKSNPTIVYKYPKDFIIHINYLAKNKKIVLKVNEAAYNYVNDIDKNSINENLFDVISKFNRYLMHENYKSIIYNGKSENPIGIQSPHFDVSLEKDKLYYIYGFAENCSEYKTLEITRLSDNKVVYYRGIGILSKINQINYAEVSFQPDSTETYRIKIICNLSQADNVYCFISTEILCDKRIKQNNDKINKLSIDSNNSIYSLSFKQATLDGANNFVYNENTCSAELSNIPKGIYRIFFDKDKYSVSVKLDTQKYTINQNDIIRINYETNAFLIVKKADGSNIDKSEGYNISIKKENYDEINLTLENGSFDGAGNNVESTNYIRTQKIELERGCRYFFLFPSTLSCTINLEDLNGNRLNRSFLYPTSIIDVQDFVKLVFRRKNNTSLQVDNLSENERKNIKVIKLYGKDSNYDICLAAHDTPWYLMEKADIVCSDENAELWLRAIMGSLYSIKALLYPGTYTLNTLVESTSNQKGCIVTTTDVSQFTDKATIEIHGYSTKRGECKLKVSDKLHQAIDTECSMLLCPHSNSDLTSATVTGISVVLDKLSVVGAGYDKPIVYINMNDAQSTQIINCVVNGYEYSGLPPFKYIPNKKCIGIRAGYGSNNGIQQKIKNSVVTYCGTGVSINGEHFILEDVLTHHCYVGFAFGDGITRQAFEHPNIMLGCSIEGCYRFMTLSKNGITEEKDFDDFENFNNKIRSTLICIGLSTERAWDIPYLQKFSSADSLPSDNNVGDAYLIESDSKKIYTWNGSSWDITTSTFQLTKGILEYVKGIYRGRIEGDYINIADTNSCKNMDIISYQGAKVFIKHAKSREENWNGM